MYRLIWILSIVWLSCGPAESPEQVQASSTETAAWEEARERLSSTEGGLLVLRAIQAHGGLETWYQTPTSAYTWEYANAGSNTRFKTYLVADNRTRQVYHTFLTMGTPERVQPVNGRMAWDGQNAWMSPDTLQGPNPRFWATTGYYFQSIPFILSDPGLRYERLPDEVLSDQEYELVRVSFDDGVGDSPGDVYTLYVNKETSLVDAIRYTVTFGRDQPEPGASQPETLFYYEDYETVDGLTVATRFRGYHVIDGEVTSFKNEAWADSISFRVPFDENQLRMPADGRIQPMP